MSWTYSGNPAASALDEIRFLIGDTDANNQILQDEEILYEANLVSGGSPPTNGNFLAAALCAEGVQSKVSRYADKSVGDLHISYNNQVRQYATLAVALRRRATLAGVTIYSGGESKADKEANRTDTDLVQPAIQIDGMVNVKPIDSTGNPD